MDNNNNKIAAIASYITWIGFVIAICIGDRSNKYVLHHINQALVINLLSIVGGVLRVIPIIGGPATGIAELAVFVFSIMGIYRAATGSAEPLPLIGEIHLID